MKFLSQKYNKYYYYNPITNERSWKPFQFNQGEIDLISKADQYKISNPDKESVFINPFAAKLSRNYPYTYFVDTRTNTVQWELPKIPIDVNMRIFLDVGVDWNKTDINYNVLMEWLEKWLPGVRYNYYITLPLLISWVNKSELIFNVKTNVYDPFSIADEELFLEMLKDPDDDGNFPIYVDQKGNLTLIEPDDYSSDNTSLVTLKYV